MSYDTKYRKSIAANMIKMLNIIVNILNTIIGNKIDPQYPQKKSLKKDVFTILMRQVGAYL